MSESRFQLLDRTIAARKANGLAPVNFSRLGHLGRRIASGYGAA
jgi:hypothetical protein